MGKLPVVAWEEKTRREILLDFTKAMKNVKVTAYVEPKPLSERFSIDLIRKIEVRSTMTCDSCGVKLKLTDIMSSINVWACPICNK